MDEKMKKKLEKEQQAIIQGAKELEKTEKKAAKERAEAGGRYVDRSLRGNNSWIEWSQFEDNRRVVPALD